MSKKSQSPRKDSLYMQTGWSRDFELSGEQVKTINTSGQCDLGTSDIAHINIAISDYLFARENPDAPERAAVEAAMGRIEIEIFRREPSIRDELLEILKQCAEDAKERLICEKQKDRGGVSEDEELNRLLFKLDEIHKISGAVRGSKIRFISEICECIPPYFAPSLPEDDALKRLLSRIKKSQQK